MWNCLFSAGEEMDCINGQRHVFSIVHLSVGRNITMLTVSLTSSDVDDFLFVLFGQGKKGLVGCQP